MLELLHDAEAAVVELTGLGAESDVDINGENLDLGTVQVRTPRTLDTDRYPCEGRAARRKTGNGVLQAYTQTPSLSL